MTGIYVHIPFCKSRCAYCDFYSTTLLARREEYVQALLREAESRVGSEVEIATIYLGGGTPSLLTSKQIEALLNQLTQGRDRSDIEITLEANPGDLNAEYLRELHAIGVNRLSIGTQSLNDELLRTIGRRHSAAQAREAIMMAREAGFRNLSADLIYGLPNQTMEAWQEDIEQMIALQPEHISCYCLSYEDGTRLTQMRDRGEVNELDEETLNIMYDTLCERLKIAGYEYYEVSNFAKPGYRSCHNSSYWTGIPYIGLGAGAHSYDGEQRSWNPDLDTYIAGITDGTLIRESETLNETDKHTERIMLGLRTSEGVAITDVDTTKAQAYIQQGLLRQDTNRIIATQEGLHILNTILTNLI